MWLLIMIPRVFTDARNVARFMSIKVRQTDARIVTALTTP